MPREADKERTGRAGLRRRGGTPPYQLFVAAGFRLHDDDEVADRTDLMVRMVFLCEEGQETSLETEEGLEEREEAGTPAPMIAR